VVIDEFERGDSTWSGQNTGPWEVEGSALHFPGRTGWGGCAQSWCMLGKRAGVFVRGFLCVFVLSCGCSLQRRRNVTRTVTSTAVHGRTHALM